MKHALRGIFPAMTTPFVKGLLDVRAARRHLTFLKEANVSGVVICGTTGEGLRLSSQERLELCKTARDVLQDTLVIMGVVTSHMQSALDQVNVAIQGGAHALLVAAPYYVKADHKGLYTYFETLHTHTNLPIILYNNPGRLGFELSFPLLEELARLPRILGIKESSPSLDRLLVLKNMHSWSVLGGDDATWPAFLALGSTGLISVGANIAPSLYVDHFKAWQQDDLKKMNTLQTRLEILHNILGAYPNPKAINYACALKGWGDGSTRLPQSPLTQNQQDQFSEALHNAGLLT